MLYIKVPDYNDSYSNIVIDDTEYLLRFTWNGRHKYWCFGVYTAERQPIVSGVKVVPKWPLTHCYPGSGLPDGSFGVITDKAEVGRGDFLDNTALFVYIPNADLED